MVKVMHRKIIIFSFGIVVLLSLLVGIINQVSPASLLFRAILSAVVFSGLVGLGIYVLQQVFPELFLSSDASTGRHVDMLVGGDEPDNVVLDQRPEMEPREEKLEKNFTDPEIDTAQSGGDNKEGNMAALHDSDPQMMAKAIQTVLSREEST